MAASRSAFSAPALATAWLSSHAGGDHLFPRIQRRSDATDAGWKRQEGSITLSATGPPSAIDTDPGQRAELGRLELTADAPLEHTSANLLSLPDIGVDKLTTYGR